LLPQSILFTIEFTKKRWSTKMILDDKPLVPDFPDPPGEISIYQAIGSMGLLKKPMTTPEFMNHCRIDDPVVRVWALSSILMDSPKVEGQLLEDCMQAAHYSSYIRNLLVPLLLKALRFDLINLIQNIDKKTGDADSALNMHLNQALVRNDYQAQVLLHEKLYLRTGNLRHVAQARDIASARLMWKDGLKHLLRVIFTHVDSLQSSTIGLLLMLEAEDARAEFKTLTQVILPNTEIVLAVVYAAAKLQFWEKDYDRAINILEESGALKKSNTQITPRLLNLVAQCHEKMGRFKEASEWFQKQNDALAKDKTKPQQFLAEVERRAKLIIPDLAPDDKDNHFIMTGFTRSGTTLLENVLGAHPDVATCEETLSFSKSFHTAFHLDLAEDPEKTDLGLRAKLNRNLYYQELERFVDKANPKAIIDKTPMLGASIKYLEKLMPNKRYIFSIRHPYDVVLSNYKQIYNQTTEMVAFNKIHEACVQYDFVMRNWYDVFPEADERVYYVVYDELVNDFDRVIQGALDHIGVQWSDEVSAFAQSSSNRAVRTPSYAKVRQGLGLGVQTTRQDYGFLFDKTCRKLLDPWVERQGYAE
jgi:tetratricopeptide (TPR) repeat protein